MLEDRVSVAVDGQRYPALPDQPLHEKEVAAGVLLLAEQSVRHSAGGVVHGQQQDEPGSLFPQPPMVAPIYLQQHPFLGVVVQFESPKSETISSAVQIWSVRPAAIAGVRR
jgi:hypothetical protein